MFLMDYRTAIATYIIILLLYVLIRTRNPEANWGSSAQSLTFLNALKSVQSLEKVEDHVKNYRPKVCSGQIMTKPLPN
jgi:solute carrier family 12 sodium/potassium/chloride transporter 2